MRYVRDKMSTSGVSLSGGWVFLQSAIARFRSQKELAEKAIAQLADEDLFWYPDAESNSIAILVQHMAGNMISRWTDFLTTDGEKPDRNRDAEFEEGARSRAELLDRWERGWGCVFAALEPLSDEDLLKSITIRGEAHSVIDAILRQLSHYGQHTGQIVFIAKMRSSTDWQTLSMPRRRL